MTVRDVKVVSSRTLADGGVVAAGRASASWWQAL
jgi:hypothetical protein